MYPQNYLATPTATCFAFLREQSSNHLSVPPLFPFNSFKGCFFQVLTHGCLLTSLATRNKSNFSLRAKLAIVLACYQQNKTHGHLTHLNSSSNSREQLTIEGRQGRNLEVETEAAAMGNTAYWLSPPAWSVCFLTQIRTHSELGSPTAAIIKKMPHGLAYRPVRVSSSPNDC